MPTPGTLQRKAQRSTCWYASAGQFVFQVAALVARWHSIAAPTHRRPNDFPGRRDRIAFAPAEPRIARPRDHAVTLPGFHRVVVLLLRSPLLRIPLPLSNDAQQLVADGFIHACPAECDAFGLTIIEKTANTTITDDVLVPSCVLHGEFAATAPTAQQSGQHC